MRHEDSSLHGTAVGHVPAVAFMRVVKRLFPTKGELSLSRLERVRKAIYIYNIYYICLF